MVSHPTTLADLSDLEALATEFAASEDLDRLREIAIALAKPGVTNKAWSFPAFQMGVRTLIERSASTNGEDRLKILALLARLMTQPSKAVQQAIRSGLAQPAPELVALPNLLPDPQDREYLAQAVRLAAIPNRAQYLAVFSAGEGQYLSGARKQATIGLIEEAPSLTAAFDLLGQELRVQEYDTQDIGSSRARRLVRTLEAILNALRVTDPIVETDVGPAFGRLLVAGLSGAPIRERSVAIEVAVAALDVLTAFVRPNFSLARDPQVFDGVAVLRRLFTPARWPDETLAPRKALAGVLREAIALLAQAGITDNKLRQTIILLLEDHLAEATLRELADKSPGLTQEVRHWLTRGRAIKTLEGSEAASETLLEAVDRDIAEAFREAALLRETWEQVKDDLADAAGDASPYLRQAVDRVSSRLDRLARRVALVASKREMELTDEVGEAVEYSPVDHEADQPLAGVRVVRIVAPKVTRRARSGPPQIVLKSRVEAT